MSSILKALRKLEEEKSARREGGGDIARDILRLPHRRQGGRPRWILPLGGAVLLVAVTVALTFHLARGPGRLPPSSGAAVSTPTPLPEAEPSAVPAPVPPPSPPPVRETLSPRSSLSRLPAEERIVEEVVVSRPIPSPREAAPRITGKRAAPSFSRPTVPPLPPLPEAKSAPPAAAAPAFHLSGIVYQSDPEKRVAVINDLPVMTGTDVEGATVREILPDRVRLDLRDGRALDLFLEP